MEVQSTVKYGQEHGENLIKVGKKLAKNQTLLKLLLNTDKQPLNPELHPEKYTMFDVLNKNIRFVPLMLIDDQKVTSKIIIMFDEANINGNNVDNENVSMLINIYCPFEEWLVEGNNLRPFMIMSEIRKDLQDARINGLGEIKYLGYSISTLTEECGCYTMRFMINAFS